MSDRSSSWGAARAEVIACGFVLRMYFKFGEIDQADHPTLDLLHKLKLRVHGMEVAYTPNVDACRACGLCVSACPEQAITLRRVQRRFEGTSDPSPADGHFACRRFFTRGSPDSWAGADVLPAAPREGFTGHLAGRTWPAAPGPAAPGQRPGT